MYLTCYIARVEHQIVSRAVVIATGITEDGGREVLGMMVGDSETQVFWTQFLRSLRERGLPAQHVGCPFKYSPWAVLIGPAQ